MSTTPVPLAGPASSSLVLANYVEETREVALSEDVGLAVELRPLPKAKVVNKKAASKRR